jgi:hypothetical protein
MRRNLTGKKTVGFAGFARRPRKLKKKILTKNTHAPIVE